MIPLFTVQNITQTEPGEFRLPWEFVFDRSAIPEDARKDKGKRQEWIRNPTTKHLFYSGFIGAVPSLRVSKENPAVSAGFLSADYDVPMTRERINEAIAQMKIKPTKIEFSIGGNCRLGWAFATKFPLASKEFTHFFLERAKKWLRLDLLPMLDEPAWMETSRLLCAGDEWVDTGHGPISETELQSFFVECARAFRSKECTEVVIGLDIVEKELKKHYENFNWPGDFELESQGPTFWVPGSTSTGSAIVKVNGIFTFAGHAEKSFYSWGDLLGKEFMEEFEKDAIAKATADIWFDGLKWHRKLYGTYVSMKKEEFVNYLTVDCHLSGKPDKSGSSPVSVALQHIYNEQRVAGAAPAVPLPAGPFMFMGRRTLNTYSGKPIEPSPKGTGKWGPHGEFTFLSALLNEFLDPADYLEDWLTWGKHYYEGIINREIRQGSMVYMMGKAGCGKTFLSKMLWGIGVGGYVDAAQYVLKGSQFNSHLLEAPHWCLDDDTTSANDWLANQSHMMIKKIIANDSFEHSKKFEVPCTTPWGGRVYCTFNDNETSGRVVGPMDEDMLKKAGLYKCRDPKMRTDGFVFPTRKEIEKRLEAERPFFFRYLLDVFRVPDRIERDSRYGYVPPHEPSMLAKAKNCSPVGPFKELVLETLLSWFRENPEEKEFRGSMKQLLTLVGQCAVDQTSVRAVKLDRANGYMEQLFNEKFMNVRAEDDGKYGVRLWIFQRPQNL